MLHVFIFTGAVVAISFWFHEVMLDRELNV